MLRHLPLILIVGLLLAFRVMGSLLPDSQPNFQPLVALFFCGALLAPGWKGFAIPAAIWAITYPLGVGHQYDLSTFAVTFLALGVTYFIGRALTDRSIPVLIGGAVASALSFHLITCTAAWLGSPIYSKDLMGLWESIWLGPKISEIPSWVFLRNLTAANVLFTGIFLGAQLRLPKSKLTPAITAIPTSAK